MLGGKAPKVDDDLVVAWMREDWEENLYPGPNNEMREELDAASARHARSRRRTSPTFELNGPLVNGAQRSLARMNMSDRAYALIKIAAYSAGLNDFYVAPAAGPDAALVFETRDGTDIGQVTVPGLYTYAGFHDFFFQQLGAVAEKLESETLGDGRCRQAERRRGAVRPARVRAARDATAATSSTSGKRRSAISSCAR